MADRFNIRVRGTRALNARINKVRRGAGRLSTDALEEAYKPLEQKLRRKRYGFTDRSGALRRSLKVEKDRRSSTKTGLKITANAKNKRGEAYAAAVEYKRRTKNRRPGPPYWLGRAIATTRKAIEKRLAKATEKALARTARRI